MLLLSRGRLSVDDCLRLRWRRIGGSVDYCWLHSRWSGCDCDNRLWCDGDPSSIYTHLTGRAARWCPLSVCPVADVRICTTYLLEVRIACAVRILVCQALRGGDRCADEQDEPKQPTDSMRQHCAAVEVYQRDRVKCAKEGGWEIFL